MTGYSRDRVHDDRVRRIVALREKRGNVRVNTLARRVAKLPFDIAEYIYYITFVTRIQAAARGWASRMPAVYAFDRQESVPPYPHIRTARLSQARYNYKHRVII
jgi:hypothetical protein